MFVAYIIGWVLLNQTKFGAHVYALGGNPAAAALNGIYVVTLLLFIRFIFIAPYFFSSRNLVNILISASLAGIVTAGYTVAILAGQIETSTQGVLAVATVTTALLSVRVLTPVMFAASWVAARSAGLGLPPAPSTGSPAPPGPAAFHFCSSFSPSLSPSLPLHSLKP